MGQPLTAGTAITVGIIGCGAISAQYLASFRRLPDIRLIAVADLDLSRAQAVADSCDGVRALTVDELLADPRRRPRLEPHHSRRPRGHRAPGHCRREGRVRRKAAGGEHQGGPGGPGRCEGRRRRRGMRSGHGPGHRNPDRAEGDRRRPDRHAHRRHRRHGHPGARALAPQPGLLLPARRRPAAGHGPLLRHRAGDPAGSCGLRDRRRQPHQGPAHHRLRPPRRRNRSRPRGLARHRDTDACRRRHLHAGDELRRRPHQEPQP